MYRRIRDAGNEPNLVSYLDVLRVLRGDTKVGGYFLFAVKVPSPNWPNTALPFMVPSGSTVPV